jgi:hypothetical protein
MIAIAVPALKKELKQEVRVINITEWDKKTQNKLGQSDR